jgi:uncharacterized Fe-S cluster-containing radical SAM superfamily enzyme
MRREINLSQLFPIEAEINGGIITIYLHRIIAGELPLARLRNLMRRGLTSDTSRADIIVKDRELMLILDTSSGDRVDDQKLVDIASNFISAHLPSTLRNRITGNRLIYVTDSSGIPLIGRIDFGIIDRGTNLIQVRPITGCVLDCPFCSVDSGLHSKTRLTDFIVEPGYMVDEIRKLCEFKGSQSIELHIDGQGEPTLYPYLPELVEKLSMISGVETISLQTNGVPLTDSLVDKLERAGLSRINLSVNALDSGKALQLSGEVGYSLGHILNIVEKICESDVSLLIAPLWVPGLNDDEIPKIVRFVKKIANRSEWPLLGIQNYLIHKHGKKVKGLKPCSMKQFQSEIEAIGKFYDVHPLILTPTDFGIRPMESYPKPFRRGEICEIEILESGRMMGEMLGVGRDRSLHVLTGDTDTHSRRQVRMIRTKHNIFVAKATGSYHQTLRNSRQKQLKPIP